MVLGPFQASDDVRVAFIAKDDALIEYMETTAGDHWHHPTEKA